MITRPMSRVKMEFLTPVQEFLRVETNAWLVEPQGWLQRLCWSFLQYRKVTHRYYRQDQMVRSIAIDPDDLARKVIMRASEQFQNLPLERYPTRVLIGRKEFSELMNDPTINGQLIPRQVIRGQYEVVEPLPMSRLGRVPDFRVLNLDIEVIPHMEGILVL